MKEVFACAFLEDAIVVKSMLESAGIQAELLSDQMLDINPFYSIEPKGAKIVVSDSDEADAKVIVDSFREHTRSDN
ncbi:hypothetical protein SPIROBIBN47_390004 [uncultured spirochete]|jgi:hypothetical protein|uniref:DUF2007 domain-containing protein n=1 Tax=uncultured spirochete TaxID=156406 RepID=A0A3P3XLP9_9SPIR|nr:hypothetical protein SPIROBIBN47_390004 [uncultured spirochete]HBE45976.1 hypothetical protein [Spirochaetaceae bacterium]